MIVVDAKKLWADALVEIEHDVSKANFGTWFKNTFIARCEAGTVILSVPNTFVRDWLASKFHKTILKALRNVDQNVRGLEYVITRGEDLMKTKPETAAPKQPFSPQLGMADLYINREDNLNPKYTFDTFIVGPFNEVAYAAAQGVLKELGTKYNPLFIYGSTGLGKTHLIQSIGNYVKKHHPGKRVYYLTTENFTVDYINSVQNNKVHLFKEKYRKYDVLILDDIQFLSNKEKTQEELFHLFNNLYENNHQIVFSSDKSPKYIPDIEDRLRSRFEGGMIADISKPDYESRLAILKEKLRTAEFSPTGEVVEYVASMVQDSIRELEGAINSIIVQSQLKKRNLNLQEAKLLVKSNLRPQKSITIKDIVQVVAGFYNIEEHMLYEKTRRKEVVKPRQIVMYILREDCNTSYPYIGAKLGGRDHTTVIHAYEKIKEDIKSDLLLSQEIEQIRSLLYTK